MWSRVFGIVGAVLESRVESGFGSVWNATEWQSWNVESCIVESRMVVAVVDS